MTKEEKIKAIYEEIAEWIYDSYSEDETIFPVMIWDVLDFYSKKLWTFQLYNNTTMDLLEVWKEKRKPIEEQSGDCIDFVFNLLPKE